MMKKLKLFTQLCLAIMLTTVLSTSSFAAITKNAQSLDRIVAVVNDAVITQTELSTAMATIKQQLKGNNVTLPEQHVFRKQVLDQLINKKLQKQTADLMGVKITNSDIEKTIKTIASNNNITVDNLYEKLDEQGLSRTHYKKELGEQLLLQKVQQQAIGAKLNVTQQEVNDYMRSKVWQAYNSTEYHLEDILISLSETPSSKEITSAKQRAEQLLEKIHHGLSFKDAAVAESGEKNALQGGDLGWKKLPEIPSVFANDLIHMKKNDLLGPVQTPNGYHIVHLAGIRKTSQKISLAEQHKQVEQLIFQRKIEENIQSWLTKLRSEAYINITL